MGFAPSSSLAIDRALFWLLPLGPGSHVTTAAHLRTFFSRPQADQV